MQTYGTGMAREHQTSNDYQARTRKLTAPGEGGTRSPDLTYNAYGPVARDGPPGGDTHTTSRHGRVARLLALLGPAMLLLSKLKGLAIFSKVGLTGLSMLVSVWAYAALWHLGWAAAIGFVVLLFVHEMGHWIVMRLKGVPASAPLFIPFLGAMIGMKGLPRSVKDEAEIGIAGPIAGTAGAVACLGLEALYGGRLWPLLALLGLYLNLFNLLPVSPLDGGRIVAAISRWLWIVGLVGLVGLFVLHPNPFLLLIALIGGAETIARFRGRHTATAHAGYYDVSMLERVTLGVLYFGLIALIAVTMLTNPVIRHLF